MTNQEYLKAYLDITEKIKNEIEKFDYEQTTDLCLFEYEIEKLGLDKDIFFVEQIDKYITKLNSKIVWGD